MKTVVVKEICVNYLKFFGWSLIPIPIVVTICLYFGVSADNTMILAFLASIFVKEYLEYLEYRDRHADDNSD